MKSADEQKQAAARRAIELVKPGMRLGLGTGSTASHFVIELGKRVADGLDVVGVPTSQATAVLAEKYNIPLVELDEAVPLDLTVDGADELDEEFSLIKGGGGALLREKIVATSSRRMIVMAAGDKRVNTLGAFPLPVEIIRFGAGATTALVTQAFQDLGLAVTPKLRTVDDGAPFVSDEGHYIIDCPCGAIPNARAMAAALTSIVGVVEHGLFIDIATGVLLGNPDGSVTELGQI